MRASGRRILLAAILIIAAPALLILPMPAIAGYEAGSPHFPKPSALQPNVEFWKRVYTEFGVTDFVLHDRDNLAVLYDVVRVNGTANSARAAELARPEINRLRAKYEAVLIDLAQGVPPEDLGSEGRQAALAWGCPCQPETLLRAAANIRVQQGLRERVDEGMRRARGLLPHILSILRRHNVPEDLAALPLVESTFNPRAQSKAGAVGLWQFIKSTGKQYLSITRRRDERRDPIRSTEAAARLLKHNYETLGSWPLAVTAYNHGKEGMLAARAAVGSSAIDEIVARYSGPRFGFASRNFYAEFLAALEIVHPAIHEHTREPYASKKQLRITQKG